MVDKLKEEIMPDEKLLWCGEVEKFETMDKTYKSAYIKRAIKICSIVAGLCLIYIFYAVSKGIELKLGLVAVAMGFEILGSLNFFSDAKKLRRTVYAITDRRIISFADVPKSVDLIRVRDVDFKTDEDGHVSVLFGKKVIASKSHQWRSYSLLDPYIDEETGVCERFAMYAITDIEIVKKLLADFLKA